MRLNMFTDIGLRVLMRLAGNPETGFSSQQLARELAISRHHLSKVVTLLAKEGFVKTRRGKNGGIALARPAGEIGIGTVIEVMERSTPLVECFQAGGGACTLAGACGIRHRLANAKSGFIREMNRTTVADVAYRIEVGQA